MIYTGFFENFRNSLLLSFGRISTPLLIVMTWIFNLALSLVFAFIIHKTGNSFNLNFKPFDSMQEEMLLVLVFAPFFETVFYQYFLIETILYFSQLISKRESLILAILIPALIFAMSHTYNYAYVAHTLIGGMSLNLLFVLVKLRKQNAFICTGIAHALYNLGVFTLKYL